MYAQASQRQMEKPVKHCSLCDFVMWLNLVVMSAQKLKEKKRKAV